MDRIDNTQAPKKGVPNYKRRGIILLILGGLFAFGAVTQAQTSVTAAEKLGGYSVPVICWAFGFYYFFKGGGKIR